MKELLDVGNHWIYRESLDVRNPLAYREFLDVQENPWTNTVKPGRLDKAKEISKSSGLLAGMPQVDYISFRSFYLKRLTGFGEYIYINHYSMVFSKRME